MNNNAGFAVTKLLVKLSVIASFLFNLTFQECIPNDIKSFPRVIGVNSTYDTINT